MTYLSKPRLNVSAAAALDATFAAPVPPHIGAALAVI